MTCKEKHRRSPKQCACEVPHAGRDAKLEDAKMLIPRLLREAGSDPVVCPRKYGLLKKKAWQKMNKIRGSTDHQGDESQRRISH